MGIFDGLNLDKVSNNPNGIADGTHKFNITGCVYGPTKAGDKNGLLFTMNIIDGPEVGSDYVNWMRVPAPNDDSAEAIKARKYLRQRCEALGFTAAQFNSLDATDFLGIVGYITLETSKKGSQFIKEITLDAPPEGTTSPSPTVSGGVNPFLAN